jgi:glycosyltransferase involved in cell wall biosynthesis
MEQKATLTSSAFSAVESNRRAKPSARMKSSAATQSSTSVPAAPLADKETRRRSRDVFFDITDIVHFAMRESKVTGIQRVQTRIVGHFAEKNPKRTYVLFQHPETQCIVSTPASGLFAAGEFDPEWLLQSLGIVTGRRFPRKRQIISTLGLAGAGRARVLAAQARVYSQALFAPKVLVDEGLMERRVLRRRPKVRELKPVNRDMMPASLVFLGTNWSFDHLHRFAMDAKEDGWVVMQLVHDLIPLLYPEFCSASTQSDFCRFIGRASDFVSHFLAVSDCTRRDLVTYMSERGHDIPVAVMPLAHEFGGHDRAVRARGSSAGVSPYVLFVGTLDRRKNIEGILAAWSRLVDDLGDRAPDLVFAGRLGWDSAAFSKLLKSSRNLAQKVRLVGAPSDSELASLYQNCLCLLLPSHAEGWGLPVGEAAWFGKVSVITGSTSLSEVCPGHSILLDSGDANDIARAVASLIEHPQFVSSKEEALCKAELRSWADVSHNLESLITEALQRV